MKSCWLLLLLPILCGAAQLPAAELLNGTVFADLDRDGVRDPEEPGVAGVAVSNGCEVVETDAEGRYSLVAEDGDVVFITKPSGWAVPVDEDNLPQFYYLHDPSGSRSRVETRYPGVDPTGPTPPSVDFALLRADEPERFDVILLADPQPQSAAELDFLRDDVLAELVGTGAAFGITLGDIMYDDLSLWPRYNRMVGRVGIPWYNVPGNHDINYLAPDDRLSLETFKRYLGPPYFSFDYGRLHFVVLDTVSYLGTGEGREAPHPRGAGTYEGVVDADQLRWLAADLRRVERDRLVVLAMHIPLVSSYGPDNPAVNVANREEVFRAIPDGLRVMAVAGHMHRVEHHYLGKTEGFEGPEPLHLATLAAASGAWWSGPLDERGIPAAVQVDGTPNGFYVMEVDGADVSLGFRAAGRPASHQMRVVLDSAFHRYSDAGVRHTRPGEPVGLRVNREQLFATEVVVNLFDGGPRSSVELRVGDRPAILMVRDLRRDPFVEELFLRFGQTMKEWIEIGESHHLWVSELPEDLAPGAHRLTVTARDEYGRRHVLHRILEVTGVGP